MCTLREPAVPEFSGRTTASLIVGLALWALAAGCQTTPKYIEGRKVVNVLWRDGHVVYVLAPNETDQAAVEQAVKESGEAVKGVVFEPVKE